MLAKQAFRFEAAHRLPRHPGRCAKLHGHSYRFCLSVDLPVDHETGMTIDFDEISRIVERRVLSEWDHRDLNELLENPTAENIVVQIWRRLAGEIPGLREIELWETPDSAVVYRGEGE